MPAIEKEIVAPSIMVEPVKKTRGRKKAMPEAAPMPEAPLHDEATDEGEHHDA
jgi:hypothetical protein